MISILIILNACSYIAILLECIHIATNVYNYFDYNNMKLAAENTNIYIASYRSICSVAYVDNIIFIVAYITM